LKPKISKNSKLWVDKAPAEKAEVIREDAAMLRSQAHAYMVKARMCQDDAKALETHAKKLEKGEATEPYQW